MKISQLSQRTGVSQRMLRYFEQEGLLDPNRSQADYREYGAKDETRVLEIREWQRLGLTLREIKRLIAEPSAIDKILEPVFLREREALALKERALRDLRERFLGKKSPYFDNRVAYSIPNADKVVVEMELGGWKVTEFTYLRFCEWQDETKTGVFLLGEIIWRSAFYLLVADDSIKAPVLERLMADFCKSAHAQWPNFDGYPPKEIESADVGDFFSPNDIVACLRFDSYNDKNLTIVLPYQAVFALAKASS